MIFGVCFLSRCLLSCCSLPCWCSGAPPALARVLGLQKTPRACGVPRVTVPPVTAPGPAGCTAGPAPSGSSPTPSALLGRPALTTLAPSGTTTASVHARAHRLFKVHFDKAEPIFFCRSCGAYATTRVNAALKAACAGTPGDSGRAVLQRLDAYKHPSRVPALRCCVVVGRPAPVDSAGELSAVPPRSNSAPARPLSAL